MKSFKKFFEDNFKILNEHFASCIGFASFMQFHEDELPPNYTVEDVVKLRKEVWRRPKGKKTKCEVYSRVVGYIRPIEQMHDGKQAEVHDRMNFITDDQLEPKQQKLKLGGGHAGRRRT